MVLSVAFQLDRICSKLDIIQKIVITRIIDHLTIVRLLQNPREDLFVLSVE
jgi:hypothetical protein